MERKNEEKNWYEKRYGSGQAINSSKLRKVVLAKSENFFIERMLALVKPGIRVLEIGCGLGEHSFLCAKAGAHVVGVDVSQEAINIANLKAAEQGLSKFLEFKVADVEKLPFDDQSFDLVLDHEVLSSVLLEPVVGECHRVLKPGGIFLVLECLGHNPIFNLNRRLKAIFGSRTDWAVNHILDKSGIDFIDTKFKQLQVTYFHFLGTFLGLPALFLPISFGKQIVKFVDRLDQIILANKACRTYAFKTVIEASK